MGYAPGLILSLLRQESKGHFCTFLKIKQFELSWRVKYKAALDVYSPGQALGMHSQHRTSLGYRTVMCTLWTGLGFFSLDILQGKEGQDSTCCPSLVLMLWERIQTNVFPI